MKLSILIASHGDEKWDRLARERAVPSAESQEAHQVLHIHHRCPDEGRATVRNLLAEIATGDWLCFLDADDELAPGYAKAMAAAERPRALLTPIVSYVRGTRRRPPRFWPEVDLRQGNWMVCGTLVEADLFREVGGWKHLDATGVPNEYDDWELWIRCTKAGAVPVKVPEAVYIAHVAPTSPHRIASAQQKLAWHKEVSDIHFA